MLGCDTIANSFIWLWPALAVLVLHLRYALSEYMVEIKTNINYLLMFVHMTLIVGLGIWIYAARSKFCGNV